MIDCREWNRVCEESIVAKYTVMKSASDEFGEFKSLVAQVSVNLIKDSSHWVSPFMFNSFASSRRLYGLTDLRKNWRNQLKPLPPMLKKYPR